MFDQLALLDTSRTTWRIKVRVSRMWPSISSSSGSTESLKGYNLILLDDNNSHMHAFVYADHWKALGKDIEEGGVYVISNFYTMEAGGTLKPTSSKININFSNSTTIEKLNVDDFMIPMNKFEFVDLGDLFQLASGYENPDNPEFSTDVIGVLEDFENVKLIPTKYGEKNIVRFRITDGRYSHKVTIWGELAIKTDELYEKIYERPIIVIVTNSKLKIFKSSVQISTLPSSKVYLNLDDDTVNAMRVRLEEEGYKVSQNTFASPTQTPIAPLIETITLTELSDKTNMDDLNKFFLCNVKVTTVEEAVNWWYDGCLVCQQEVMKVEGRFKCVICSKTIPVAEKRYKIVLLAGDATEAFNFVLSDRAAKRIIGFTATKMISDNEMLQPRDAYPQKIKDIAGKELTFTVVISDDNVLLKSKIFKVTDAYDSNHQEIPPSKATTVVCSDADYSENIVDLDKSGNTPCSAKNRSKKIKTEK